MTMRRLACAVLAAGVLFGTVPASRAETIYVDDDGADFPAASFSSIGSALGAAVRGDTVRVFPGTYNEQVVITKDVDLVAESSDSDPVVIQPLLLPDSRPSVLKPAVAVTGGILVDGATVTLDGFHVDMSLSGAASCLPVLTGVYMRNASGAVRHMVIEGARVTALPTCDSGVALYIESGKAGEIFGEPVYGSAHVRLLDNVYADYQKAGMVANGLFTAVSGRNDRALGSGPSAGAVQYGFQVGAGAKARLRRFETRDHASTIAGKSAAGMLVYRADRVRMNRGQFFDSQTGLFVVGDGVAAFSSVFENLTDDGIVFLGDTNVSVNSTVHVVGESGVFIDGNRNGVRSGFMSDMLVGVWIYRGLLNRFAGIRFEDVPIDKQGVYGGDRDLDTTHAAPLLTCAAHTDCDDGNACTYDVCDLDEAICYYYAVVCEDFNVCTDDSCDVAIGCVNAANTAACDDANVCTASDVCAGGACAGTAVVDGTPCGTAMTCTAGVCS